MENAADLVFQPVHILKKLYGFRVETTFPGKNEHARCFVNSASTTAINFATVSISRPVLGCVVTNFYKTKTYTVGTFLPRAGKFTNTQSFSSIA